MNKLCPDQCAMQPMVFSKYPETYIRLAKIRTIFLAEDLTKDIGTELSALLLYYDNISNEDISLYIHCRGGDAAALINIYDVMQMIRSPVQTICMGKASSAAAVLLAAGSKGKRFAFRNSRIMIHGIQCTFPIPGHDQVNSKNYFDFLKNNNDRIMNILAHHVEKPAAEVINDCKRDIYMDSKEALEYGIIDFIVP